MKGKIAWCISPIVGGTTTAYRIVGKALRRAGWEVLGVVAGDNSFCELQQTREAPLEFIASGRSDVCQVAAEFVRWVEQQKIDIVLSIDSGYAVAAAPALPSSVRFVYRCPSITRHIYSIAAANSGRADMIVVPSPRQHRDLTRDWGVPPSKCTVIPNGVEIDYFKPGECRDFNAPLRLVYLGRLDEPSKAVLILPRIGTRLLKSSVEFQLDLIGDGSDGDRLKRAFALSNLSDRINFHGTLQPQKTLPLLQRAHVFVLPSRFEGMPWSLLETMSCGCVPVASRIEGVTDSIIGHGLDGFLCRVGTPADFASVIVRLAGNRNLLKSMSKTARKTVVERFSSERCGAEYDSLFTRLLTEAPGGRTRIPLSKIEPPPTFDPGLRRFIPQSVKNQARTWAERFGWSI